MSRYIDRRFPPNWSADKEGLYWREWAAVKRVDKFADRHELHVKALGHNKSHLQFTNNDFTEVLGVFRAISKPADLISQLEALENRKRRLIFGIERAAKKLRVGEAYVLAIARKQTDRIVGGLNELKEDELENVRIAMALQIRRRNRAAAQAAA